MDTCLKVSEWGGDVGKWGGADILARFILSNPEIVGFKIKSNIYKITQFADDTTLILDGSVGSMQAALNTLEIFGSFSGLRMNKEKTKVIWIGRKKFSKDKLKVSMDLNWGSSEFRLLGITFNVDLCKMPELNLENALIKANLELKKWQLRKLTPIGKVIILKSFILSKFIHIFSILPVPENFIKNLTSIFFKYLWNNKPDKIKRETLCSNYLNGGLKMIKISDFIKSLKICWIRRIICNSDSQWIGLFHEMYGSKNLFYFESNSLVNIKHKITNPFWIEVLQSWQLLSKKCIVQTNNDIMNSCIWFNQKLTSDPLYLSPWYKNGIYCIGDIIDNNGEVERIEEIKKRYSFNVNILDYYRIRRLVQNYISKSKFGSIFEYARPVYPFHIKILTKSKKGCQDLYNIFTSGGTIEPIAKTKWEPLFDCTVPNFLESCI